MQNILIIGATSAIAQATARLWARPNTKFILVGRNADKLKEVAADLEARGALTAQINCDLDELGAAQQILDLANQHKSIDQCLYAAGTLRDNDACVADVNLTSQEIQANYVSPVRILIHLVPYFQEQGRGLITVISSVAGDRGRQSNFVYGSAKAGLSAFTEGLRGWLAPHGVHVQLVKPGPTATPMTAAHDIRGPLMVPPEKVAQDIAKGVSRNKPVIYTPGIWRWIMMIIRQIPNRIFDRLKL